MNTDIPVSIDYALAPVDGEDVSLRKSMAWASPQYSRQQVDDAGETLISDPSLEADLFGAYLIISNWRSSHNFPLNTFQNYLRFKSKQVDPNSLVAQRIKRLSSISLKLRRFRWLKLSEMQDIGGCRAIVSSVSHVKKLVELYKQSDIKHKLDHTDDYIEKPKKSGYRGVHLIYKYHSDKNSTYNGLKIEVQLRSPLQHAWATAVETVGIFTKQALKSSQGEADWLRFFALMGTAIAIRERCNPVPTTPTAEKELRDNVKEYVSRLDVVNHLAAFGTALQTVDRSKSDDHFYLLELDPTAKQIKITGYKRPELERASNEYLTAEQSIRNGTTGDAVLVSVESLSALKRAFPNYFLDTHAFIDAVKQAIG